MYQRFISILIKKLDDAINHKSYYFLEYIRIYNPSFQDHDNHGISKLNILWMHIIFWDP